METREKAISEVIIANKTNACVYELIELRMYNI